MSEYNLARYMVLMISINVILGLATSALASVNPENDVNLINFSNTAAGRYASNGLDGGLTASADDVGLDTADSVDADTGNIFTDAIKTVKAWWTKMDTQFSLFTSMLKQPYSFLKNIGIPMPIATAFGIIWYMVLALLIVNFIKGGTT